MKGKGKGGGDKGERLEKGKGGASNEDMKETVSLNFPDMKPVDHNRLCPRYTAGEYSNMLHVDNKSNINVSGSFHICLFVTIRGNQFL